jgi:hypothetical protein
MTMSTARARIIITTAVLACLAALAVVLGSASGAKATAVHFVTVRESGTANANSIKALAVVCPAGRVATGGGFEVYTSDTQHVLASEPYGATGDGSDNGTGWIVEVYNTDSSPHTVYAWAVCASLGS